MADSQIELAGGGGGGSIRLGKPNLSYPEAGGRPAGRGIAHLTVDREILIAGGERDAEMGGCDAWWRSVGRGTSHHRVRQTLGKGRDLLSRPTRGSNSKGIKGLCMLPMLKLS
jgi:hypothetical protein